MAAASASAIMAAASAATANQQRKLTPKDRGMFHLKRIMTDIQVTTEQEKRLFLLFKQTRQWQTPPTDAEAVSAYAIAKERLLEQSTIVLLDKTTKFGRNPEMVDIVLHSDSTGNQMVSRLHAEIHAEVDLKDPSKFTKYYILDKSLNGTYVNNNRAPVETQRLYLKSGDVIRFGHSNGAAFKPGEFAQVIDSEFSFVFEPALDNMEYLGHTPDGNRVERKGPKAYMHIGASAILPHEFDHFSLVPKREPELSIVPLGMRGNKEQRKADMIPAHTQLLLSSDRTNEDANLLPTNSSAAAVVQIPGISAPTVVPNMTNFDVSMDVSRLLREFQGLNGLTQEQANSLVLQQILNSQTISQPNFNYYQQPQTNPLLQQLSNYLVNQQRLNTLVQQPSVDSILQTIKQITTPLLNSHASYIPEYNQSSINGGPSASSTIAVLQALGNQGGCNAAYQAYSEANSQMKDTKKQQENILNALRNHHQMQEINGSASTPASTTSDHNDEFIIAQKKALAEAEARKSEAAIAALLNGIAPASSMNSLHPEDRELISRANSVKSEEFTSKKVVINDATLQAIANAAEAAAATSTIRKPSPQMKSPPIKKEKASRKKHAEVQPGPSTKVDHVQETIDAVAKRVIEGNSEEKEDAEEAEAIIREQMMLASPEVVKPKSRRPNKKASIEESNHTEKNNAVLKLLDNAKIELSETKPSTTNPVIKVENQEAGPSKVEQKEEKPVTPTQTTSNNVDQKATVIAKPSPKSIPSPPCNVVISKEPEVSKENPSREPTSSVDSLIVCEATMDDPGLKPTNDDVDIIGKQKQNFVNNHASDSKKKSNISNAKIKQSSSSSDSDSDFEDKKKSTSSIKKQNSYERGRKKSSSVKQRVIRVPRSPIPSKRGPERIPGHKSNEVARLLYDLEVLPISGSYMHVARLDKRRKAESVDEDSSSDDDQPPAMLQKRKSIDGRISESPAKKIKDSDDANGNLSSDSDDASPKINGNTNKKRKSEKVEKKKKEKEKSRIKLDKDLISDDASSDGEDEPTPKKKKANAKIQKPEKKSKKKQESTKKRRGRKKNQTFVELTNGEWEKCAFAGCKHPRIDGTVNWVQCDDCDRWFHIFCAFGREDKCVLGDEFHCGCKRVKSTAVNAAIVTA